MRRLADIEARRVESPDQQISLTDPDARSMATSGRGSGVVGYNVQVAVETEHHLIVAHEVTNVGSDRSQLATMAKEAKAVLRADRLDAVADRGYFNSEEILACEQAGITVTLPKPMTSGAKAEGRFGKQDFVYRPEEDVYRCPAGATLKYHYTNVENGLTLRRYWTTACPSCPIKRHCTPAKERRITRWEHEPNYILAPTSPRARMLGDRPAQIVDAKGNLLCYRSRMMRGPDTGMESQPGAAKIEITPAMIEAGVDAFWDTYNLLRMDVDPDELELAIKNVFVAMLATRQKSPG